MSGAQRSLAGKELARQVQAEENLRPITLAMASDEIEIIDPLTAALERARKWDAAEDLLIKAQCRVVKEGTCDTHLGWHPLVI